MKKEQTQELEQLSMLVFGKKYAYRRLLRQGLVYQVEHVGRGRVARRRPLSPEGCKAYMEQTIAMRTKIEKELEEKNAKG